MINIIFSIYLFFLIVIFLNGVRRYKDQSMPFKILIILIGLTVLSESIGRFLAIKYHNSMPVYHIISPIEYICITLIYIKFLRHKKLVAVKLLAIPLILFSIFNTLFIQGFKSFPSNGIMLFQIVYLGYSMLGFSQMLLNNSTASIRKQSFFWLNTSLLFFSSTQLLLFGLVNYANGLGLNLIPLLIFSYIINMAYYVLLTKAIITDRKYIELSLINEEFHKQRF
jgi:hypothetical protein